VQPFAIAGQLWATELDWGPPYIQVQKTNFYPINKNCWVVKRKIDTKCRRSNCLKILLETCLMSEVRGRQSLRSRRPLGDLGAPALGNFCIFFSKLCNFRHILIEISAKNTFLNCCKVCWRASGRTIPGDLPLLLLRHYRTGIFQLLSAYDNNHNFIHKARLWIISQKGNVYSLLKSKVELPQKYPISLSFEYNTQIFAGHKILSCGPHLARRP